MPLDESRVRSLVDSNIPTMMGRLCLGEWTIEVTYEHLEDCRAEVELRPGHRKVFITMDPQRFDDEDQVLRTLRHELLHVLSAEFDVYRKMVRETVASELFRALDYVCTHAEEVLTARLERMLDNGLGISVSELCRKEDDGEKETGKVEERDVPASG